MNGEVADYNKLYDAALTGDVTTFQHLLQQDPNLLNRISLLSPNKTPPLHVATLQGNLGIVEEMLKRNPNLAKQLDYQKSSPLHIAAAEGQVEIASLLLSAAPNMCWVRDSHNMNPVHIAAVNGHAEILKQLIRQDSSPARERVDCGQTALHLCVKHGRWAALDVMVHNLGELVHEKDDDGDTIFHLAHRYQRHEIIQYLVHIDAQPRNFKDLMKGPVELVGKVRDTVMVVSVLIAAMAFQAIVSPPGGVWQDDSSTHRAGEAVMASTHPKIYTHFVRANTVAFVASIITIFLVTTRLSSANIFFTMAVVWAIRVSLASIAVSYGTSATVITPAAETQSLARIIAVVIVVSVSIVGLDCARALYRIMKIRKKRRKSRG